MNTTFKMLGIDLNQNIDGSMYFYWKEALWLPKMNAFAIPSLAQKAQIIKQARALDPVRRFFGQIIDVHCWLRPVHYNSLVNGAKDSRHLYGDATDFSIRGVDCEEAKKEIIANNLYTGRGEINSKGWIHLDLKSTKWFEV